MVFRIIATALDIFYALILLYFVNSKKYNDDKVSNWMFGTMFFAFGLSAVMMWR